MSDKNSVVAIFDKHTQAEAAVQKLRRADFSMKKLSIVGKDYHTDEHVVGYYTTGDRMLAWGMNGAFWGGMWGLLFGSTLFFIPGIGPVIAGGTIVACIVAGLESAAIVGGLSALGAGLVGLGIPEKSVLKYETSIKAGKFMLVVHGTADEVTAQGDSVVLRHIRRPGSHGGRRGCGIGVTNRQRGVSFTAAFFGISFLIHCFFERVRNRRWIHGLGSEKSGQMSLPMLPMVPAMLPE